MRRPRTVKARCATSLVETPLALVVAMGLVVVSTTVQYLIIYMPSYATTHLGLPGTTGFIATLVGGAVLTVGAPLFGMWSDRIGRVRIMAAAAVLLIVSAIPAFELLSQHANLPVAIMVLAWLGLLKAAYSGALPALLAELFPIGTRASGISIAYNVTVTSFGAFGPYLNDRLIQATGSNLVPSFYLTATALVSCWALTRVRALLGPTSAAWGRNPAHRVDGS